MELAEDVLRYIVLSSGSSVGGKKDGNRPAMKVCAKGYLNVLLAIECYICAAETRL